MFGVSTHCLSVSVSGGELSAGWPQLHVVRCVRCSPKWLHTHMHVHSVHMCTQHPQCTPTIYVCGVHPPVCIQKRVTGNLSTHVTDDSCKTGSAYTGHVVNGRIVRAAS